MSDTGLHKTSGELSSSKSKSAKSCDVEVLPLEGALRMWRGSDEFDVFKLGMDWA